MLRTICRNASRQCLHAPGAVGRIALILARHRPKTVLAGAGAACVAALVLAFASGAVPGPRPASDAAQDPVLQDAFLEVDLKEIEEVEMDLGEVSTAGFFEKEKPRIELAVAEEVAESAMNSSTPAKVLGPGEVESANPIRQTQHIEPVSMNEPSQDGSPHADSPTGAYLTGRIELLEDLE